MSTILIECTPVCGNCRGSWRTIRDSDEDDENDTSNLVESQHKIQLYYIQLC